jgi:hypothetical protein
MKKVLVGGVGAGLLSAGGVWVGLVPLVIRAMTPDVPFADQPPPPPPDYDLAAAWSALPGRVDAADVAPAELPAGDQATAPADVFYVHPTSYVGSDWNAPFDDPKLQRDSDAGGARLQASAFNACGAVYAPYYRQANGTAFYHPTPDGDRALDVAYADVRAAFRSFLAHRGGDRPFLVAAHSQGSVLAERLLAEEVAGTPLRDQLVAAWLPGATVLAEGIAPDLLPCRDADDLHCVIAWNARRPDWVETEIVVVPRREGELLCTNPLTWTTDATLAPASSNRGAVFLDAAGSSPRVGFASARCAGGTLLVDEVGRAPRDLMSRILDHVLGKGNLHPIEYQLYWANLRENAAVRVAAATAR